MLFGVLYIDNICKSIDQWHRITSFAWFTSIHFHVLLRNLWSRPIQRSHVSRGRRLLALARRVYESLYIQKFPEPKGLYLHRCELVGRVNQDLSKYAFSTKGSLQINPQNKQYHGNLAHDIIETNQLPTYVGVNFIHWLLESLKNFTSFHLSCIVRL